MPERVRVLHLIERLSLGGAGRSLIAAAGHSQAEHALVSLRPPDARAARLAAEAGIALVDPASLGDAITAHDVLNVHFWNTPELYAALRRPLPPFRVVLTAHVLGTTAPHVLTAELIDFADRLIVTTPETQLRLGLSLPRKHAIPEAADFARLAGLRRAPGPGFTIGYVGTVDFVKMHPDFVAMHAALGIADLHVRVAGSGSAEPLLRAQAEAMGMRDRFEWLGQVEDLRPVYGALDVFGYPLCAGNYATTELVLHEAMFAGLPCVLLADGGPVHTIADGETGFIARTPADYADRIRALHADPALRTRIGAQAAEHARAHFGAPNIAPRIDAVYREVAALPRRARALAPVASGASAWLRSLGDASASFDGPDAALLGLPPVQASADTGGLLHYRRVFPSDPTLRFWAGLVLLGQHRPALAAGEFKAARDLGFDAQRATDWLARAIAEAKPAHQ